jgi:hypothetical protein
MDVSRTSGTLGPVALLHQRSHLLTYTRSFTIRVIDEIVASSPIFAQEGPGRYPECVTIPDFLSLLAHTPGLRNLRLSVYWSQENQYSFKPFILDWLSSLVLPIEVLDLKYGRPIDSPLVYDVVRLWPTLRALRVRTNFPKLLPERPNVHLRELRLPITSLATVIEWFLPTPSHHDRCGLRILELYEIPEGGNALLSAHGSSITSLTLSRQPASGLADLFTDLDEFVIAGPFWSSPLPSLPKTLMHIRLQVHAFMSDSVLPSIATAVPSLEKLRLMSVEEALTTDKHYPILQEACKTHGVEILVNPIDSSLTGTVVSDSEPRSCGPTELFANDCLISTPILRRWTAFHDNIHLRNSSMSKVELQRQPTQCARRGSRSSFSKSCKALKRARHLYALHLSHAGHGILFAGRFLTVADVKISTIRVHRPTKVPSVILL